MRLDPQEMGSPALFLFFHIVSTPPRPGSAPPVFDVTIVFILEVLSSVLNWEQSPGGPLIRLAISHSLEIRTDVGARYAAVLFLEDDSRGNVTVDRSPQICLCKEFKHVSE